MAKGDRYVVLTMDKQTGNAGGLSAHIDREVYDAKTDRMVPFRPKSVRDDSRTALNRECIESVRRQVVHKPSGTASVKRAFQDRLLKRIKRKGKRKPARSRMMPSLPCVSFAVPMRTP